MEIEQIPIRPIQREELAACTVPVFLLFKLQDLVDDLQEDLQAERRERRRSEKLISELVELLVDLDDDGRRRMALYKMRRQLKRREAEYSLPTYFWRRDKERTTEEMLKARAKYLIYEKQAGIREIWALLTEFNDDYSGGPVTNAKLEEIIMEAKNAPTVS